MSYSGFVHLTIYLIENPILIKIFTKIIHKILVQVPAVETFVGSGLLVIVHIHIIIEFVVGFGFIATRIGVFHRFVIQFVVVITVFYTHV